MYKKVFIKLITLSIFSTLLLSGCGGGDGDSSSGASPDVVGTYNGTQNITLVANGQSQRASGNVSITIASNGTVTFRQDGFSATGALNGNSFTVNFPGSIANSPGINCGGTISYSGSTNGTQASGNLSSSGVSCNSINIAVSGNFSANKANAKALSETNQISLKEVVSRLL